MSTPQKTQSPFSAGCLYCANDTCSGCSKPVHSHTTTQYKLVGSRKRRSSHSASQNIAKRTRTGESGGWKWRILKSVKVTEEESFLSQPIPKTQHASILDKTSQQLAAERLEAAKTRAIAHIKRTQEGKHALRTNVQVTEKDLDVESRNEGQVIAQACEVSDIKNSVHVNKRVVATTQVFDEEISSKLQFVNVANPEYLGKPKEEFEVKKKEGKVLDRDISGVETLSEEQEKCKQRELQVMLDLERDWASNHEVVHDGYGWKEVLWW